jgi:MFS transporter, ACS family, glucarate transporter
VRWAVALMVGGFAFVSYVERMNISIAAEQMMPDLSLSKIAMGHVFSSFLLGYALFQIPAGRIGDSSGARLTLAFAALIWGLATVATGLVPDRLATGATGVLLWLLMIRFVLGAGEAATFPVGARAIRNWIPAGERALGNSLMMVGSSAAAAITGPAVSWLTVRVGWRGAFYATSLLAFGMAIIWYVFVPKDNSTQRSHATINQSTVDSIADKPLERQTKPSSLAALLRNRNVLILSLSYTCEGYVLFIFVFWLYIYLVEVRGFTILSGGMAASLPWITALVMTLLGGWTCDRITRRKGRLAGARSVIMIGYGLSGVLLFGAARFDSRIACLLALCFSVGFLYFAEPAFWATAVHLSGENAGAASGLMNTAGILGGVVSTSLTPVIVKYFGWMTALGSGAAVALACTAAWFVIGRRKLVDVSGAALDG